MVKNCANPDCGRPFRYLHEGRLLKLVCMGSIHAECERYELFWLCSECAERFAIIRISAEETAVVPRNCNHYATADDSAHLNNTDASDAIVLQRQ
jgi:hypothetical protein